MLEHVPNWLGTLMRNFRAGHEKLVLGRQGIAPAETRIDLGSPAFPDGQRLPVRFTADGEGVSPPLIWGDVPAGTRSLVLIVEDPDAPAPSPLVHAIVVNIAADHHELSEGVITADSDQNNGVQEIGRNSFLSEGWLPPDPPTGHGTHDYVFQLFALDIVLPAKSITGRSDVIAAISGHVLGAGVLVGTYSRRAAEGEEERGGDMLCGAVAES